MLGLVVRQVSSSWAPVHAEHLLGFLASHPKEAHVPRLASLALHVFVTTNCTILKLVVASAANAELGVLFLNAMQVNILRLTLHELVHPQPPPPIHVDNTTAVGNVNSTIKHQRSRAVNMRHFWLLCQEAQRILSMRYYPGADNLGDYQTKLHNGAHHERVCPFYVRKFNSP